MIGKTISHYKILEKLGEGGMGIIYKAEDTKLERTVALKFLPHHLLADEEDKTRFLREAQAAAALNHPNIMTIHEINEVGEETYIVTEFVSGETLKDKVGKGPLKTKQLLNISIAVAEGLQAAHKQEIVHRDIKSENIMISQTELVKIMDFGLAKRKGHPGLTKAGLTAGTLAYMSPEQAEGQEVDHRSDLFSFGVVMYEMATGHRPFRGEHEAAILYSIVNEAPVPVTSMNSDVHPELERIIHKALEKEVEDRYQHADDLMADLRKLKKDIGTGRTTTITTQVPVDKKPPKKPLWSKPTFMVLAALVTIVAILEIRELLQRDVAQPVPAVEENSLAVLFFENLADPADPERLGQILQELVIADLSGIAALKVFSSQRLFDIQKQLGSRERRTIDPELATEVARQAGAQTMLMGNLIQAGEKMILTSQLVDTFKGTVIESQRAEGDDMYAMVDDLAVQIKGDLNITTNATDQVDIAVREKTSSSVDAYQHYLAGVDLFNESRFDDAIGKFQQAIAVDSTFGKAYYKMAIAQWWSQSQSGQGTADQARESLTKILTGSWYASTKEKLMAEGAKALVSEQWDQAQEAYQQLVSFIPDEKEAWYGLGEAYFHGPIDFENALEAFERVLEYDPEYTLAYRHIFDIYSSKELYDRGLIRASQFVTLYPQDPWGHFYVGSMLNGKGKNNQALKAFQEAVELDPEFTLAYEKMFNIYYADEQFDQGILEAKRLVDQYPDKSWSYGFLGAMYRGKGAFEQTLKAYQEGLLLAPQDYGIIDNLGYTYQLMGRYDRAALAYSKLLDEEAPNNWQQLGRAHLGSVYAEQGQYRRWQEVTRERLERAKAISKDEQASTFLTLAYLDHLLDDRAGALARLDSARSLGPNINAQIASFWIEGMIRAQDGDEPALTSIINTVQKMNQEAIIDREWKPVYNALLIHRYTIREQYDEALKEFTNLEASRQIRDWYLYDQALLYLKKLNYDRALEITEKMQSPTIHRDVRALAFPWAFYLQGRIFEEMGESELAKENYEALLNLWRDGDEALPERRDALERLSRLTRELG